MSLLTSIFNLCLSFSDKKIRSKSVTPRNTRSNKKTPIDKTPIVKGPMKSVVLFKEFPSPANSTIEDETDDEQKEIFSDAQDNLSPNSVVPVDFVNVPQTTQKVQMKKRNLSIDFSS